MKWCIRKTVETSFEESSLSGTWYEVVPKNKIMRYLYDMGILLPFSKINMYRDLDKSIKHMTALNNGCRFAGPIVVHKSEILEIGGE